MKKFIYSMMALAIAAFAFTSCEDVPMPYDVPTQGGGSGDEEGEGTEPAGSGTAADPFNIAAINQEAGKLGSGETSTDSYYFMGKVSKIKEVSTGYGNASFYLKDSDEDETDFYVYHAYGFDNKKITDEGIIQVGDTVVVCGQLTNYNGTLETEGNKAYIVSVNGKGGSTDPGTDPEPAEGAEAKGTGTAADPFNVAAAIKKAQETGETETATEYYIKGVVLENSTTAETIEKYGNMTFTMVDEGYTSSKFTAFQVYGPNKEKFTSVDQVKVGQTVVVCGKIVNYKSNTPETVGKGAAYVVSIDGEGSEVPGEEPGDEPGEDPVVTGDADVTMVMMNLYSSCTEGSVEAGSVSQDGVTLAFDTNGGSTSPKYYWNATEAYRSVRMYAMNKMTVTAEKTIETIKITCAAPNGSTNYNGNSTATATPGTFQQSSDNVTVVISNVNSKTCDLVNEHTEAKGGVQLRVRQVEIIYAK